jgi:hypothetical protein
MNHFTLAQEESTIEALRENLYDQITDDVVNKLAKYNPLVEAIAFGALKALKNPKTAADAYVELLSNALAAVGAGILIESGAYDDPTTDEDNKRASMRMAIGAMRHPAVSELMFDSLSEETSRKNLTPEQIEKHLETIWPEKCAMCSAGHRCEFRPLFNMDGTVTRRLDGSPVLANPAR